MNPRRIIIISLLTLAAGLAVRRWVAAPIYVASDSMAPAMTVGGRLLLDRVTFRFRSPRRGEVISFKAPEGGEYGMVKRVIALGGDRVELRKKQVYLNGEPLREDYAYYARPGELLVGDNLGPLTVPPGHFFVLGDNRDNSYDSASWKDPQTGEPLYFVPLSAVAGKVRGGH
jgi:signal peptidase I